MHGTNEWRDPAGVTWPSRDEWLFGGIMGGCACGRAEELALKARHALEYFGTPHEQRQGEPWKDPTFEVLAHWMHSFDLIEHGGSVLGAWLTPRGQATLATLRQE